MEYCEILPEIFGLINSKVISIGKTLQVNNIFYFIEHRNCVHSTPDGPVVF